MTTKLNDAFNIETATEVITTTGEVIVPNHDSTSKNIEYDYEKSRSNLHALLAQGQDALFHALEVAKSSEHPRAFEVVGGLMKQLADVNHQLLDLSEKKQKLLEKKEAEEAPKQVTNNNAIFVGSTAELSKMLTKMNGE